MIELNNYSKKIKKFLNSSIRRFQEENKKPNSIGIYCCPWSVWISTNFNVNKKITDTKNNCPDFEFVEFDFLDLTEWQNEYETDKPKFKLGGSIKFDNHDFGDEGLNQLIFEFLKPIVIELKDDNSYIFLLQMLDSNFKEEI